MNLDIDTLINEDVDIKNKNLDIFKKLEDGYSDLLGVFEKFEKPLAKIIDNFKEYARETSENQEDSPFFSLAKSFENLIDAQKQYTHDVNDDLVLPLQQLINKSKLLNEAIKELNSAAKNARKLKNKILKIEEDIEVLQAKGKPEKIPKKETEKQTKEAEYNLARDRLAAVKDKFESLASDFATDRNEILKKGLSDLVKAEKQYISVIENISAEEEKVVTTLGGTSPIKEKPTEELPPPVEDIKEEIPVEETKEEDTEKTIEKETTTEDVTSTKEED
ncbi:MAG: hypothetical protein ACTSRG_12270 [Candidatus Helarchaeota archaeon]